MPSRVETMVLRDQLDEETTRRLLANSNLKVALMVAVGLDHACDGDIPPTLFEAWEKAMIAYDFAESDSYEHGVGEALKRHPNTIVKWLLAKVNEKTPQYSYGFSPRSR